MQLLRFSFGLGKGSSGVGCLVPDLRIESYLIPVVHQPLEVLCVAESSSVSGAWAREHWC